MSEIINESLKKIVMGSTLVFTGTIISLLLGFLGRIILIRFATQSEYGVYSLAIAVIGIFVTLSTMGLNEGSTRYIAYFKGKNEGGNVKNVISSSVWIALISSAFFFTVSFFTSDFIAVNIFHLQELSIVLKIFSITIPATVFMNIFISIFRGFNRVDVKMYFNDILRPALYVLFLVGVVSLIPSFIGMVYAHVLSITITLLLLCVYVVKKHQMSLKQIEIFNNSLTKELLLFSIPLLAVSTLLMIMTWTDTMMLGYFKTSEEVGIYNVAITLAHLLTVVISSMGFLYVPVTSHLYAKNQMVELKRSHAISTKWVFVGTVPLFFILFLFPDVVLNLVFGSRYIGASFVLQVLALGYIFNSYFGLNYYTLIATGKSNFIMQCSLISTVMNVVLNIVLIPPMGILGAAIASALSFAVIELLMTAKLYAAFRIHPFTKSYLKLTILTSSLIFIFYFIKNIFAATVWTLVATFSLFLLTYFILIVFMRCFDKEDIMMVLAIEEKMGIKLSYVKRILQIIS